MADADSPVGAAGATADTAAIATSSKEAVAPAFEPPLRPAEPDRDAQPRCSNCHDEGSACPSAQTFPWSTPPDCRSRNVYHTPTCQANW